jgi:hypothetical protein
MLNPIHYATDSIDCPAYERARSNGVSKIVLKLPYLLELTILINHYHQLTSLDDCSLADPPLRTNTPLRISSTLLIHQPRIPQTQRK